MNSRFWICLAILVLAILLSKTPANAQGADRTIDLTRAAIVTRPGSLSPVESTAAQVLAEEVQKRTGLAWPVRHDLPSDGPAIVLLGADLTRWSSTYPARSGSNLPERKPEGFRLVATSQASGKPVVWIVAKESSGLLYGVGQLLRLVDLSQGKASLPGGVDIATAPRYPIRGHQLGYRSVANSYDGWDVARYEQYIRDLALFGCNAIENIPGSRQDRLMPVPPDQMHRRMSEICARYGMQYWLWMPASVDLGNPTKRAALLEKNQEIYRGCDHLTGVFVPGGDPGDNPPELLLPFLAETARQLMAVHPKARVWFSVQGFHERQVRWVFDYLKRESPTWLGGLVGGPSSPPLPVLRAGLPPQYPLRRYPDLTHNKLSQFQVSWWDQAYALTEGREAINPRPLQYAAIHNWYARYADGFISYSDGAHDDVNKTVWSALAWDPDADVREILIQYARVHFNSKVATQAADGILALEHNWQGVLRSNSGVDNTLLAWQKLEREAPELAGNWRWQMCLVRAYYDAYVRARHLNEQQLEREANAILAEAPRRGAAAAMEDALAILNLAVEKPVRPELRRRIVELCEALFQSIRLQTSVEKYGASGEERGAILDFVDYPLNNRWWLKDEFARIRQMASEKEKLARLEVLRTWENPGEGSFYDDLGNAAKSPHVRFAPEVNTDPEMIEHPQPTYWWLNNGKSRARLSWQCTLEWPEAVVYEGLDPKAHYVVRSTGYGKALLRIDGQRVEPTIDGREMGQFKLFPVPQEALADRKLVLTWDTPKDEEELNWRQQSRIAEVWLLKQSD